MRSTTRAADAILLVAVLAALASLPPDHVPWPWIAGYALPAVLLLAGQRTLAHRPATVAVLATVSLVVVGALLRVLVPANDAAPVACVLVAPLAYFGLRRLPGDHRYTLFLALCVLVVGSVLDVDRARWLAVVFGFAGVLTLRFECVRLARQPGRGPRAGAAALSVRVRHTGLLTAVTVLAAISLYQLLTFAPVPSRDALEALVPDPPRRLATTGLSEQFDLGASDGWLDTVNDLRAPSLVAVRRERGSMPHDLYLRFVHFDLAGANRWSTAKYLVRPQPSQGSWTLFEPEAGWRRETYTLEREPLTNGNLLLPEGTWRVRGVQGLEGHEVFGLLRETEPGEATLTYVADTIVPGPASPSLRVDPYMRHLLILPEPLTKGAVADLAARYGEGIADDMGRALAITRNLRRDYRYTRRDPTGPWPDVLHNFLFEARAGYCMHFASALAVLLRLQHIPCRVGAGLYGGRADERPEWRVYGESHAHAWVEVPCIGAGWVVLDATPPHARGVATLQETVDVPAPSAEPGDASASAGFDQALLARAQWLVSALFLAGLVLVPMWLRRRTPPNRNDAGSLPSVHPARRLLGATLGHLARQGVARRRQETLGELASRALGVLELDVDALRAGFSTYEEVRFGSSGWNEEAAERMRAACRAAAAARPVGVAATVAVP